jgi:hypothetical protein
MIGSKVGTDVSHERSREQPTDLRLQLGRQRRRTSAVGRGRRLDLCLCWPELRHGRQSVNDAEACWSSSRSMARRRNADGRRSSAAAASRMRFAVAAGTRKATTSDVRRRPIGRLSSTNVVYYANVVVYVMRLCEG